MAEICRDTRENFELFTIEYVDHCIVCIVPTLHHRRNFFAHGSSVKPPVALVAELDTAVRERKERVVVADADIGPREDARTALAHDDCAAPGALSGEELYAEIFRL